MSFPIVHRAITAVFRRPSQATLWVITAAQWKRIVVVFSALVLAPNDRGLEGVPGKRVNTVTRFGVMTGTGIRDDCESGHGEAHQPLATDNPEILVADLQARAKPHRAGRCLRLRHNLVRQAELREYPVRAYLRAP